MPHDTFIGPEFDASTLLSDDKDLKVNPRQYCVSPYLALHIKPHCSLVTYE